ncbi:MAG: selenocysteine-specific translation elongation factor [Candidatus Abyssobacteria bacterium SURF_17]|uniref:Selenocysteine-specific elongation factor n=1 Tax=Candidatus Abyssobacteria bacterium SURF_17 TaxID=2093361 RepID=A0A419F9L1_9BACT|nr:MAG: selenocysteine-specific translation elongation factor [Candidatus Abyssubacteria bacterium SURF_17]
MKHLIVGTAGHIDHGKSALVKALTGTDPDRLKEEKERGMTIDLGFAYFDLPDGTRVAFVDVPGHERFVKNMLAGASGMDIVILVIDATESVMPQTREHLDIMKLLDIRRGIIAITKADLADEEMVEIVEAEVGDLVQGTFLESAPVVKVSAKTGAGLEELRKLIGDAISEQSQKSEAGLFRFPIDRIFTMKGFGTVVTGTVFSGWLTEDESVIVLPSGLTTRARQLQSHNVKQERVSAGMRASMNLSNVSVQQLNRGDTLVRPGTMEPTSRLDAKVMLLPSAPRKLPRTSVIKFYVTTSQQTARMSLVDKPQLAPGDECYVQLRLEGPLCVVRGDRFVIRGGSPEFTIGGGLVLDVASMKLKRKHPEKVSLLSSLEKATSAETVLAFLSEKAMGTSLRDVAIRMGEPVERVLAWLEEHIQSGKVLVFGAGDDMLVILRDRFEQLKERILHELEQFFASQPHRLFMPREQLRSRVGDDIDTRAFEKILDDLARSGKVEVARDEIALKGRTAHLSPTQQKVKDKLEQIYREAGVSPPTFSQAEELVDQTSGARKMLSLLIEEGILTKIGPTLAYHRDVLESAVKKVTEHFGKAEKLGVGDLKDILGVSRKHAVPLLEYFDKIGLTTRVGDYRVLKQRTRK